MARTIMEISREMNKLYMNQFMCRDKVKVFNKVFGLRADVQNFDYGVRSVDITGASYSMEFTPRIVVDYKKGNWAVTYHRQYGEGKIAYKSTKEDIYEDGTDEELREILDILWGMIETKKMENERSLMNNMGKEEFLGKCLEYAKELCASEFKDYDVRLAYGSSQSSSYASDALLFTYKEDGSQRGYIKIGCDENKQYSFTPFYLCWSGSVEVKDTNDFREKLYNEIRHILE